MVAAEESSLECMPHRKSASVSNISQTLMNHASKDRGDELSSVPRRLLAVDSARLSLVPGARRIFVSVWVGHFALMVLGCSSRIILAGVHQGQANGLEDLVRLFVSLNLSRPEQCI